uniref:transposase n=1 Tax=Streptomyces humidus TaxID=52259 RepID=UPI003570C6BD
VARRAACGIPDDAGHVEKWQLALDMLDETRSWGLEVPLAVGHQRRVGALGRQRAVRELGVATGRSVIVVSSSDCHRKATFFAQRRTS